MQFRLPVGMAEVSSCQITAYEDVGMTGWVEVRVDYGAAALVGGCTQHFGQG